MHSKLFGYWGPDLGHVRNTSPNANDRDDFYFRKEALCHYLMTTALAVIVWSRNHPDDQIRDRFAAIFRAGYSMRDGVIFAFRFSPGGTSGFDWHADDEFSKAANFLEKYLAGEAKIPGPSIIGAKLSRQLHIGKSLMERRHRTFRVVLD
jgi:hypothetical protein